MAALWKHIPFCVAKRVEKKVGTHLRKNICNALKQTLFKTKQTVICISPRGYLSPQISKNHHWTSLGSGHTNWIWESEALFAHHQVQGLEKYCKSSAVCYNTTFNKEKRDIKYLWFCHWVIFKRHNLGIVTLENSRNF